ncbi:hypothetical protein ABEF95_002527 [Exophiala dermatitidis]
MILARKRYIISSAIIGCLVLIYMIRGLQDIRPKEYHLLPNQDEQDAQLPYDPTRFSAEVAKAAGENYTRVLVMGRLRSEDVSWVSRELPGLPTQIYTVDSDAVGTDNTTTITSNSPESSDPSSRLPANKGHEAMVYLTYIIDHYASLPDVVLFLHPHRRAWHNNVLLDIDAATTIKLLSDAHVTRQGYFNTRCHLDPGCPNWLHVDQPRRLWDLQHKPEEPSLTKQVFHQLFGNDIPVPHTAISQPCCAQFAVSGQRIRQRPLADYIRYREWLLKTELNDTTSGRIMEYSWQYIFTGKFEFCPSQARCYCDGYGICFEGGDKGLQEWLDLRKQKEQVDEKLSELSTTKESTTGDRVSSADMTVEDYKRLSRDSKHLGEMLDDMREQALRRGWDPKTRAEDCGREWRPGDGY